MKANQNFRNAEDAVSPVIGVILMVAITVVLAAVVFVLVSDLSGGEDKAESVAFKADSPRSEVLTITMLKAGPNAPYNADTHNAGTAEDATANDVRVSINGEVCELDSETGLGSALEDFTIAGDQDATTWGAGQVASFDVTAGICGNPAFASGDEITVTVTVRGTLVFDDNVVIR